MTAQPPFLARLLHKGRSVLDPRGALRAAFSRHYQENGWGEAETVSGPGSTLERTADIRRALPALVAELGVRTLLDAGCGDFHWFQTLSIPLERYIGTEVVPELAAANQARFGNPERQFLALDVTRDRLPQVDLILCRDCLVHLKNGQVRAALRNFAQSGARYLLATTFTDDRENRDIPLGGWRPLNLERPPFSLPPPLRRISERQSVEDERYTDKSLALWELRAR
ncbi:MAG TPA: class I SAM-dependent methyltransferase [Thermoanaerobaculia bacterium]|nr:class I SAM-dependent methyltransferase [Thermoanaerobaculia bacterium]